MKTGHTESAGYCLIASAQRGERRLLSVLVGAPTERARNEESQKLLNFGFQAYEALRLYQKDQEISKLAVWKGSERDAARRRGRGSVRDRAHGHGQTSCRRSSSASSR